MFFFFFKFSLCTDSFILRLVPFSGDRPSLFAEAGASLGGSTACSPVAQEQHSRCSCAGGRDALSTSGGAQMGSQGISHCATVPLSSTRSREIKTGAVAAVLVTGSALLGVGTRGFVERHFHSSNSRV